MENHLKNKRFTYILVGSLVLLAISFASALMVGRFGIKPSSFFGALLGNDGYDIEKSIIINLRLPRTVIAALVGAALKYYRNYLQDKFNNSMRIKDSEAAENINNIMNRIDDILDIISEG